MVSPDLVLIIDVNVARYRSCSKSQEALDQAWRDSVPGRDVANFLIWKSLVWWKNNYKHLGHHQVNQEAIPVSTNRRLSGELRLCSYPFHLLMHSNHNVFIGKMMMECNTSLFWDYCDNATIDRSSLKSWIMCQCLSMRRWEYLDYHRY